MATALSRFPSPSVVRPWRPGNPAGRGKPLCRAALPPRPMGQERERTLIALLPLVRRLALKMREHLPAHVELDDLVGAGVLGLIDAVDKFDAAKRVKLETYARHRIRGAVLDGLRALDPVSRDLRRQTRKAARVQEALERRLERPATAPEMSRAMGMGLGEWYRTAPQLQSAGWEGLQPSAMPTVPREGSSLDDPLPTGPRDDPFEWCIRQERREALSRLLAHLPDRQRQIIALYYQQEWSMKEIGARLGVHESRVSQIHSAALRRLRGLAEGLLHVPRRGALAPSHALAPAG